MGEEGKPNGIDSKSKRLLGPKTLEQLLDEQPDSRPVFGGEYTQTLVSVPAPKPKEPAAPAEPPKRTPTGAEPIIRKRIVVKILQKTEEKKPETPEDSIRPGLEIGCGSRTYTLIRKLDEGGMGQVYYAGCKKHGAPGPEDDIKNYLALKFIKGIADSKARAMFIREANLGNQLKHSNIVHQEDYGYYTPARAYYIAMEYVHGMDLNRFMQLHNLVPKRPTCRLRHILGKDLKEGEQITRIPDHLAAFVIYSIAKALKYAHNYDFGEDKEGKPIRGLFHRDISPANTLLKIDEGIWKLADLGIAVTSQDLQGEGGHVFGKIPYLPPETITESKFDARSDIWALGAVLYEMMTGIRPFEPTEVSPNLQAQVAGKVRSFEQRLVLPHEFVDCSPTLSCICGAMLALNPDDRPQTAEDVLNILGGGYMYAQGLGPTNETNIDYCAVKTDPKLPITMKMRKTTLSCLIKSQQEVRTAYESTREITENLVVDPDMMENKKWLDTYFSLPYKLHPEARRIIENGGTPAREDY